MANQIGQIQDIGALKLQHMTNTGTDPRASVFGSMLKEKLEESELKFSKHAVQRVEQRGIEMTDHLLGSLQTAVQKAREKGAKDVVVIGESGAFIVNVPNNTVVTSVPTGELKENIFTNIDSAVIM